MPDHKEENKRRRACANCGRVMAIQSHNLCGGCNSTHKKYNGKLEYESEMLATAARLTGLNYERPEKINPDAKRGLAHPEQKLSLDLTVKQAALIGIPKIIEQMRTERDAYLSEADKLAQAINILEPLK